MMGLSDIRDLISSLFIMLNKRTYILFRIEFLVVLTVVFFLAMFIIDIFRRHIHSSTMKAMFSLFDAVSDSIVTYLLGAMQTAPFKNQLFPVWALVLVIFRHSADFISGHGVPDRRGRRFTEWRNVVKLLGSAFLNWTRGSRFAYPLWSLWALQMLRSWYRLWSHTRASHSFWHGESSELVSEHMRPDPKDPGKWEPKEWNPNTLDGYKYLVYGERVKLQKPRYVLQLDNRNTSTSSDKPRREVQQGGDLSRQEDTTGSEKPITWSPLITLDKIWSCQRHLLSHSPDPMKPEDNTKGNISSDEERNIHGNNLKDLSLAFALSRLLRCRLEDVTLESNVDMNRKLVREIIIGRHNNVEGAFKIMEQQLAFVNDYFNTRFPMVFWSGLFSLFLSLFQSVVTFGVVCWLSVEIRKVYEPPNGELAHVVKGFNVDMFITWVFMFFMMFKEIWEMVIYLVSDWTRLLLVCRYAMLDDEKERDHSAENLIVSFFKSKVDAKRWHGLIDQYVFVESFDDRAKHWNRLNKLTTGMVPKKVDGAKLSAAIQVPDSVRSAILEKLGAILDMQVTTGTDGRPCLRRDIRTLSVGIRASSSNEGPEMEINRSELYGWACYNLQRTSEVILVWHIATSICEMALAKQRHFGLDNTGCVNWILSLFTCCCSSKQYLIDVDENKKKKKKQKEETEAIVEGHGLHCINTGSLCSLLSHFACCCSSKSNEKKKRKLTEAVEGRYVIANSLSRYCAYLLVSKPELIPDTFLVPKMVFQRAVKDARGDILQHCDSLESRYNKLSLEAYKAAVDPESVKIGQNVLKQGALLGKLLLDNEDVEGCWETLAGVWAELLIHIAPSWNAEAHKKCIESGGEFITNIWALLWHCGIEKSSLWPADDAYENNGPADSQVDAAAGNNNISTTQETPQAVTDPKNHQIRNVVREEDEIVEVKQREASNLMTKSRGRNVR